MSVDEWPKEFKGKFAVSRFLHEKKENEKEKECLEKEIAVAEVTKKSAVRKLLKIYREALKQKKYIAALKALELSLKVCGVYEPSLNLKGDPEHPIHIMADAPPTPQSIAEWEAQVLEAQKQREKRRLTQGSESQEKEPANIADRNLESERENRASKNEGVKHKSTHENSPLSHQNPPALPFQDAQKSKRK